MTIELGRALVNVNGVSVPGVFRNGAFVSETPIETFVLYRSGPFASNQTKSFTVGFSCKPKTVLISDSNSDTIYSFGVTTPEGATWNMAFSASNTNHVQNLGTTKLIAFPPFVLEKGTKIAIGSNKQIQGFVFFTSLAINLDVEDF